MRRRRLLRHVGIIALASSGFLAMTGAEQPETGDLIASVLYEGHNTLRQTSALADQTAKQLQAYRDLFTKGFSFESSPGTTVQGKYEVQDDGSVWAVFNSASGNDYRYPIKEDPAVKKALAFWSSSLPAGSSGTSVDAVGGNGRKARARRQLGAALNLDQPTTALSASAVATTLTTNGLLFTNPFLGNPFSSSGPPQLKCAWQAYVTGRKFNVAYPDLSAVYQVLVQLNMNGNDVLRIRGTFPKARYFSLQCYNVQQGQPISTIRDYEIVPDAGSKNPFSDPSAAVGTGQYSVYVTLKKDNARFPNSLSVCPGTGSNCFLATALIIMRLYVSDPKRPSDDCFTDPPDSQAIPRLWGYQSAPEVSMASLLTGVTLRGQTNYLWRQIPTCDPTRPTLVSNMLTQYMNNLVPAFPAPVYANMKDNFFMYLGSETTDAGMFPNLDATYLVAMGNQQGLAKKGLSGRLVGRIRGTLPVFSRGWEQEPKVPAWASYSTRYLSFSSVAFTTGGPTLDTISDVEVEAFYKGSAAFQQTRAFSIVVAQGPGDTCGLYNSTADLFLSTTLRGGAPQDSFGVIYRQLISKYQRDGNGDQSIGYARVKCSASGSSKNCDSPRVLRQTMADTYPSIEWFTCATVQGKPVLTPITDTLEGYLHPG